MNKTWLKEKVYRCFLLLQSRPFIALVLVVLIMAQRRTALQIIATHLLVFCSLAMAACAALRTGEVRQMSAAVRTEECPTVSCCIRAEAFPVTCWMYRLVQMLRQASNSSLLFVKMYLLSNLNEEGLFGGGSDNSKLTLGPEQLASIIKVGKIQLQREQRPTIGHGDASCHCGCTACAHNLRSSTDIRGECHHGKAAACRYGLLYMSVADEGRTVPDMEICNAVNEEEEEEAAVCKRVLETTTNAYHPHDNVGIVSDAILQPMNVLKAATLRCPSEDEHSVEKLQILPTECCTQFRCIDHKKMKAKKLSDRSICNSCRDGKKVEITDAELQKAASEYYTLEGDVLWFTDDMKKQSNTPLVTNSCRFCKKEGDLSQQISLFSLKTVTGVNTVTDTPANGKSVHYNNAKRPIEGIEVEEIVHASAEQPSEDAVIDRELRAIARSGNKGESSNYMSTAGSFRDSLGSFRELESFWSEYDFAERQEDEYVVGCCDNHARACILHSKSRSKVLQTDPLLSKTSLTREQEIMDVLWREYDDDKSQKQSVFGKRQKGIAQKQRAQLTVDGTDSFRDVLKEERGAVSFDVLQNGYGMRLDKAADFDDNSCRTECDKPCWAKARGCQRRRHLLGLCKLFRDFGLKQCVQQSKVDN